MHKTYDTLALRTRNLLLPEKSMTPRLLKRACQHIKSHYKIKTLFCKLDRFHPHIIPKKLNNLDASGPFVLATFNPYVIDYFGYYPPITPKNEPQPAEHAFIFVGVEITKVEGKHVYHYKYRQLSSNEEADVQSAYYAGIEHMSEILLNRGYW